MAFNLYYLNDKYTKIYDMIVRKVFSDLNHAPVSTTFVQQFATRLIPRGTGPATCLWFGPIFATLFETDGSIDVYRTIGE